jgi:hypothetical protein
MNSTITRRQLIDLTKDSTQMRVDKFHPIYSKFATADTEFNFQINLTNQPVNWIYRTKQVNYTLNGQYYRCDPFDKINWEESILIFGCSNTFGVGLDDSDTISARLQELTGFNVVNLGVGGSCQQISLYNTVLLKNNNIKPKAIIHIWTDSMRPFSIDKDYDIQYNGPWNNFGFSKDVPTSVLDSLFVESKAHVVSAMFNRMTVNSLYNDIPIVHASHFKEMCDEQNSKYPKLPVVFLPFKDRARDLLHPGVDSSINAAQILHSELIKFGTTGETRTLNPEGGRF